MWVGKWHDFRRQDTHSGVASVLMQTFVSINPRLHRPGVIGLVSPFISRIAWSPTWLTHLHKLKCMCVHTNVLKLAVSMTLLLEVHLLLKWWREGRMEGKKEWRKDGRKRSEGKRKGKKCFSKEELQVVEAPSSLAPCPSCQVFLVKGTLQQRWECDGHKEDEKVSDPIHCRLWPVVTHRKYVPEAQADPEDGTKKPSEIGHSCLQLSSFEEIRHRVLCCVGLNVSITTEATIRG